MVVGQVQSGKTANYTGLICKAVDAGYKLIIVLAGMQNSLRSQTQLRLDEGFLGFDSQVERAYEQGHRKGAGLIPTGKKLIAHHATNSSNQGDFTRKAAGQFGVTPGGGVPLLFVVKKNKSVLNNLYQWAVRQGEKDKSGKRIIKDVLDYEENKSNGLSVIAVGGNKLSRGLTLEGLTVSYYLRASRMYDTLMQMGRWFGYRPGYADVCRLYTTDELVDWYRYITLASEELRQEFDYMTNSGGTPADFGLKVRTHPQGMMITGANKMATGTNMQVSFAGSISETTIFYKDENINRKNLEATEDFIDRIGSFHKKEKENYIWTDINSDNIISFLLSYESHSKCRVAKTSILTDYIRAQRSMGELTSWTVVLISSSTAKNKQDIAENKVGLIKRQPAESSTSNEYKIRNSRFISLEDEWLDLSLTTRDEIIEKTNKLRIQSGKSQTKRPNGRVIREKRHSSKGLILLYPLDPTEINFDIPVIGFAISFPNSNTATTVEYKVNNPYWQQEYGGQ